MKIAPTAHPSSSSPSKKLPGNLQASPLPSVSAPGSVVEPVARDKFAQFVSRLI